jgi:predicted acylesterase/phospholipase RssA
MTLVKRFESPGPKKILALDGGGIRGALTLGYLQQMEDRYNTWLDNDTLQPLMKKDYSQKEIDKLVEMSNAESRFELYDIGKKAAVNEMVAGHFPLTFKNKI